MADCGPVENMRREMVESSAFVAYYRVSTDRQGASGLGLDAQRQAVAGFLGGSGQLVAECTEIEAGKSITTGPNCSPLWLNAESTAPCY